MKIFEKRYIMEGLKNPSKVVRYIKDKATPNKVANLPTAKKSGQPIARKPGERPNLSLDRLMANPVNMGIPIAIYFEGKMNQWYQIQTWLSVFGEVRKQLPMIFLVRNLEVFKHIRNTTTFPVVYCRTIDDLFFVYESNEFKSVLYVNHAAKNFQSLINARVQHVHINHGESDKLSTITNQANAYDYVFIVGPAAYERYEQNLLRKNMNRFIKVGRPQLDQIDDLELDIQQAIANPLKISDGADPEREVAADQMAQNTQEAVQVEFVESEQETVPARKRKIVLYAPTWEGTHTLMNYSSLTKFGVDIVNNILGDDSYFLMYKAHPNTGSRDNATLSAHKEITQLVEGTPNGINLGNADVLSAFGQSDIGIFDNSTVAIDYLAWDKPMIIADTFEKVLDRVGRPKILDSVQLIDKTDAASITEIIETELEDDSFKSLRHEAKKFYLGDYDYQNSESTRAFIDNLARIAEERDQLVEQLQNRNDS